MRRCGVNEGSILHSGVVGGDIFILAHGEVFYVGYDLVWGREEVESGEKTFNKLLHDVSPLVVIVILHVFIWASHVSLLLSMMMM